VAAYFEKYWQSQYTIPRYHRKQERKEKRKREQLKTDTPVHTARTFATRCLEEGRGGGKKRGTAKIDYVRRGSKTPRSPKIL